MWKYVYVFLIFLLLCAFGFNIFSVRMTGKQAFHKERRAVLEPIMGRQSTSLELGSTEALSSVTLDALNMSWYDYRELSADGLKVSIYVAYWEPKTVSFFEMSQHVPDQCWIGNGMVLLKKLPCGWPESVGKDSIPGVNARTFGANSAKINTWFWQSVGGHFVNFDKYGAHRTFSFLFDNISLFLQWGPQVFLRIDSPDSWEDLNSNPRMHEVIVRAMRELLSKATVTEQTNSLSIGSEWKR